MATFDIVPTDDLYPVIFDLDIESEKPINDLWEACDFKTSLFIMNLGSLYIVLLYICF